MITQSMEKTIDSKRKSRNLSEKKRRDQFNNLINELNNLIDPHFNNNQNLVDDEEDICASNQQQQAALNGPNNKFSTGLPDYGDLGEYQQTALNRNDLFDLDTTSQRHATAATNQRLYGSLLTSAKSKAASSSSSLAGSSKQRKMDKSSVLKCAMEFLKQHAAPQALGGENIKASDQNNKDNPQAGSQCTNAFDTSPWKPSYITDDEFSVQMLEALDAFIVVCEVNSEAKIIYSSDTLTNLLNYTGTCNSLKHYDYVSLFDLIAPFDKAQIEKLFFEQLSGSNLREQPAEDTENQYQTKYFASTNPSTNSSLNTHNLPTSQIRVPSLNSPRSPSVATIPHPVTVCNKTRPSQGGTQNEYISLIVNFRLGLNLTDIKQKHLQQRNSVLQPNGHNQSNAAGDEVTRNQQSTDAEFDQCVLPVQQRVQDIYMQNVNKHDSTTGNGCARSQQSIAEQQQHLLSDGRREQQEHNQHQQQQHHRHQQKQQQQQQQQQNNQSSRRQAEQHQMHVDDKQRQQRQNEQHQSQQVSATDAADVQQQLSDRHSGDNNGTSVDGADSAGQQNNSGTNSDENDQPSSAGSDEASDSNQSQTAATTGERRHHYRHHHLHHHNHNGGHVNSQHHNHPRRHQKASSSRQQYELVRLMGTFKGLDDNNMKKEDTSHNRYKFEEPPPFVTKSRYFICIGRLDIPRFSYDLKIIAPPMRGGSNVFHNNQFLSKHTLKWRFLWVDNRAPAIIGYLPFEVLGTSGYDYYHWDDLDKLVISHEGLMRDGQASSGPYRFLTKGQQWIWLQTKYCIILKPQYYAEQRKKQLQNQYLEKIEVANIGQHRSEVPETPVNYLPTNQQLQATEQMAMDSAGNYQTPLSYSESAIFGSEGQTTCQMADVQQVDYNDQQQQISYYNQGKYATTYVDTSQQHEQQQRDNLNSTYSGDMLIDGPIFSNPKKFRFDQNQGPRFRQSSLNEVQNLNQMNEINKGNIVDQQYLEKANEQRQNEQRRYEKLLKSNDLIKRQSIKAGNSFSSRSLDQFKFILCTHTVIGFDESDGYVTNTTAPETK